MPPKKDPKGGSKDKAKAGGSEEKGGKHWNFLITGF